MSNLWALAQDLDEPGVYMLDADESRHVTTRRLRVGDWLVLFDGAGRRAEAQIEATRKKSVEVRVDSVERVPAPVSRCVVATAIPKGDRLSTMLQMLTQLGVTDWQPLVLQDSAVRSLDPEAKRLRRILVESAKVARRPWLLSVAAPRELDAVLADRDGADVGPIYFGDREGSGGGFEPGADLVLIGPEAGFTESERERMLQKGALPCAFSPHNLRIEVAAISAAVALNLVSGGGAQGGSD